MSIADIQAVIESAKTRGIDPLEKLVRARLPGVSEPQVEEAVDVAMEVIETVPVLLAEAEQTARDRGLEDLVNPILRRAENYYLRPVDLMPEMTQGLAGLVDDSYLVLRVLQNLQRSPNPLLDQDLDEPLAFLKRLCGPEIGARLDEFSVRAMLEMETQLHELWSQMSIQA